MLDKNFLPNNLVDRLTQRAQDSLSDSFILAAQYPQKNSPNQVKAIHLLYALTKQEGSIACNVLSSHSLKESHILNHLKSNKPKLNVAKNKSNASGIKISSGYKKVLMKALNYAMKNNQQFIGTEHLLYGALDTPRELTLFPAPKRKSMRDHLDEIILSSISIESLSEDLNDENEKNLSTSLGSEMIDGATKKHNARSSKQKRHSHDQDMLSSENNPEKSFDVRTKTSSESILESFCENLSQKASRGELDPLVGREDELQRVIQTLLRKNKSNPLLVGDPGVGKTALINGLAQKIVGGNVPYNLLNKQIFSLNLSALIAGTMFRGEFEERMRDLVEEASADNIILFIDEIHTLVGAGSAQGSLDAANIIKPSLLRGEFQCIGATTYEEYKKSIEKDGALDRRFQKISMQEESPMDSIETLKKLKHTYEKHHNVTIPNDIIKLSVDLSVKYIPSRTLPDKAIDILDEAASKMRTKSPAIEQNNPKQRLLQEHSEVVKEKEEALKNEQYQKALLLKNKQELIEEAWQKVKKEKEISQKPNTMNEDTIYEVLSEMTSIPLTTLSKNESKSLAQLEKTIRGQIIGQEHAVKRVVQSIRRNRIALRNTHRPIGSYLFMGPSGVGKTELAKVLAQTIATSEKSDNSAYPALIKLDMSEMSEAHTIARLIGAPPGYVGYEEAGFLTDKIRKTPYSVVLFDEIEKAHPKVFNILLQILEDGSLTDSHGKTASFKNALIILTSNVGTEHLSGDSSLGFGSDKNSSDINRKALLGSLKQTLRPEVINRLDEILIFENLDEKSLTRIAVNQLRDLSERAQNLVSVTYAPSVSKWIVAKGLTQKDGARAIRKNIEEHIEGKLAEYLLKRTIKKLKVAVKNNKLTFISQ